MRRNWLFSIKNCTATWPAPPIKLSTDTNPRHINICNLPDRASRKKPSFFFCLQLTSVALQLYSLAHIQLSIRVLVFILYGFLHNMLQLSVNCTVVPHTVFLTLFLCSLLMFVYSGAPVCFAQTQNKVMLDIEMFDLVFFLAHWNRNWESVRIRINKFQINTN